jgi:hypothetical protein
MYHPEACAVLLEPNQLRISSRAIFSASLLASYRVFTRSLRLSDTSWFVCLYIVTLYISESNGLFERAAELQQFV